MSKATDANTKINSIKRKPVNLHGSKIANTTLNFDPDFDWLVHLDPDFEQWQPLAAQWFKGEAKSQSRQRSALCFFFVRYIHQLKLNKNPIWILQRDTVLPDVLECVDENTSENWRRTIQTVVSDFLAWALKNHFSPEDAEGHRVIPDHLHNPFPRAYRKSVGLHSDNTFSHVTEVDSKMEDWRALAAEWIANQRKNQTTKRNALNRFLYAYIIDCNLERNPIRFLNRSTPKPPFKDALAQKTPNQAMGLTREFVKYNNLTREFLTWLLEDKLSIEVDGQRIVPPQLHNPLERVSLDGVITPTETVKSPLSIRYIKELRGLLAQGPTFGDWTWAHQATGGQSGTGDWFVVDPSLIDRDDPDCVWRQRDANWADRKRGLPSVITELWSPVRAVALYVQLEVPLRNIQVRLLDSGEADTWRYIHNAQDGAFVLNDQRLATGTAARPRQRGVFHRTAGEPGAGLFINTNKTADTFKRENDKGYVIPWCHQPLLSVLEKLRNWQERYNPLPEPTPWSSLESKHFSSARPHESVLEERGTACFLFRDAGAAGDTRFKPICKGPIDLLWYKLLLALERKCEARGETLADGTPMEFVVPDSVITTRFSIHSLRVSLITYLVLDMRLPLPIVSKLIAGHARIVMTLYYTKFGKAYMSEVLQEAEKRILEADQANHARFLQSATLEQIKDCFASVSVDAVRAAIQQKSASGFVFEDKGMCPVGGSMCDVGGEATTERTESSHNRNVHGPVPGYPQERNCVRCRFFLTSPAFLPGLVAHFNALSYETHERTERHNERQFDVTELENLRAACEQDGRPFTEHRELQRLHQRFEAEAEGVGKLLNDMQATFHLIKRCEEIRAGALPDGALPLVAAGGVSDVKVAFEETSSELFQLEVLCENAVIFPEVDARKATLRRSQILDIMLELNKMPPVFFKLTPKQQLDAGNAVMRLIQARAGSMKNALPFVEGRRRLMDLGLLEEEISAQLTGTPARQMVEDARRHLPISA
ncbi:VPA1269 family protein [Hydrogenophaga sp.]|uniref:gamma-mobile-trio integrase GmtZ n=1 Tax=Hydrogenophaga sp. TaxID=1904254 RepID=UPI002730978A|nr:VPA1269 family protein [Hydrogenophaga sp.]MDP1688170.1 VPA1269 family protein [Hydrogenophaga sp.]